LQKEAMALPSRVETIVHDYVSELGETVDDLNKQYVDLAARGRSLVNRIRRQQATQDLEAQAKRTATRAKTATTQIKKAVDQAASQTKKAASQTKRSAAQAARATSEAAKPAKSSAKATSTSAKKTADAAKQATRDAAAKTGS
jgi:peptidoglycan hydrolase CwlO-like protein